MIDLSVVIVTYKCRAVALDCLRSLFAGGLDGLNAEVFVIDNNSGDKLMEAISENYPPAPDNGRAFGGDIPHYWGAGGNFLHTVSLEANVGFSAANNVGLARATGRNVLLLNPDTLVPPGALKRCVDFLDAQPETVGGMGCRVVTAEGVTQWECARKLVTPLTECVRALWPFSPPEALPKSVLEKNGPVPCLLGAFMLLRKSALDAVGPLDERFFLMYEDVDLCKRLGDAGLSLVYWPDVSITHLGGSSWKQEKIKTFAASHASAIKYLEKHHPRSVGFVRAVVKFGLELRLLALRLRKPDAWSAEHVQMVNAAREALR